MYVLLEYSKSEIKNVIFNKLYNSFCYANLLPSDREYIKLELMTNIFYDRIKDREVVKFKELMKEIEEFKQTQINNFVEEE